MAGRETAGYGAADADLFVDRPWVVVPTDPDDLPAIVAVETLAVASRARPIRMDAATHDLAVAAISHLPLIVAAALVEAVAGPDAGGASPAGWPVARGARSLGLARHDAVGSRRRGDGRGDRGDERAGDRRPPARVRGTCSTAGWRTWSGRGGPDEAALARRLAAAREQLERPGVTERVFVVPRGRRSRTVPGWYGIRTEDLDAFVEALERRRPLRAAAADGGGSRPSSR